MADGFVLIDPDPGWKQLKKLGRHSSADWVNSATRRSWFDMEHARLVTQLALQLYDGLVRDRILHLGKNARRILEAAAILHDVGRARAKRGHHKDSYRLIRKIVPPLGWTVKGLRAVAAVARYHCGVLL
jgi:exopolyphosphatase/guanosine-5'-triphosphate,3'-diphosphate pyrophosphatase